MMDFFVSLPHGCRWRHHSRPLTLSSSMHQGSNRARSLGRPVGSQRRTDGRASARGARDRQAGLTARAALLFSTATDVDAAGHKSQDCGSAALGKAAEARVG